VISFFNSSEITYHRFSPINNNERLLNLKNLDLKLAANIEFLRLVFKIFLVAVYLGFGVGQC
jgi:hypothetical protein